MTMTEKSAPIRRFLLCLVLVVSFQFSPLEAIDRGDRSAWPVVPCAFGFATGPTATPSSTSATIEWVNEAAGNGFVFYGTDPFNLNLTADDGTTDVFTHVVVLSNLTPSTQYFYQVQSTNSSGQNVAKSDDLSFTTLANPVEGARLSSAKADPRHIDPGKFSTLSVQVSKQGQAQAGVPVTFTILSGVASVGSIDGTPGGNAFPAVTDAQGVARARLTGGFQVSLVKVKASSASTTNALTISVGVR